MPEQKKIKIDMAHDLQRQVSVVTIEGKLDLFSFKAFKDFFEGLANDKQAKRIIIDLTKVTFIASSGWSVLAEIESARPLNIDAR